MAFAYMIYRCSGAESRIEACSIQKDTGSDHGTWPNARQTVAAAESAVKNPFWQAAENAQTLRLAPRHRRATTSSREII